MTRRICLLTLCAALLLVSCSTAREAEIQSRNVAEVFNSDPRNNACGGPDIDNIQAITELSTQILLCHVEKISDVEFTQLGSFCFTYEMKIEKILMDVSGELKENDIIPVSSTKGIITGTQFLEACAGSPQAQKFGYTKREYKENDIIISTAFGCIPIETGKSYLIYLVDSYDIGDKLDEYIEFGRMFLYEYTDGVLYEGMDYKKMKISYKQLEKQISADVKNRSGRRDEIGAMGYIRELEEQQRKAN